MATFTNAERLYAGKQITLDTGSVSNDDTLVLHGKTLTITEWKRRGVIRTALEGEGSTTYLIESDPDAA
ncbi:MAG: hypothetical protein ACXW3B_12490 [Telluria sp.]